MTVADTIPHFAVASADLGGDAAFAAFRQSVADVFDLTRLGERSGEQFRLDVITWHLGSIMVGRFCSDPLRFDRSDALVGSGGLDHLLVQLYVEGGFVGDANGAPVVVRHGEIVVFDLALPLATESSAFTNISFLIPRAFFEAVVDDVGALHGAVLPRESPMAGVLASYMEALAARMPALPVHEAATAANATAALVTMVLATCAPLTGRREGAPIVSPFRRAAAYVAERLADPHLDATAVARGLGMSRATLYRVFAPVGGVAEYIRRRRLTAAAVDLAAPENARRTIAHIGYGWGFASEATFNRSFRAAFGITPGAARDRGAALWTLDRTDGDNVQADEQTFGRWMRTLHA